jgi:hypothetical protein
MSETPIELVKRLNKEFELALDALLFQAEGTESTPVVYQTKEGIFIYVPLFTLIRFESTFK